MYAPPLPVHFDLNKNVLEFSVQENQGATKKIESNLLDITALIIVFVTDKPNKKKITLINFDLRYLKGFSMNLIAITKKAI